MTIEAIGQARLSQNALELAINEGYQKALVEHGVYPVTPPSISISKHPSFTKSGENELIFEVEFDILPKAKIGDYKKIKVAKINPQALVVTDEEVEKVVKYLRRQAAELKDVNRAARSGDWVLISFVGSIKKVMQEKLTSQNFPMVIGETPLVPGFEPNLIGMKKGETKEFDLKLPKDFADKDFADKEVHFKLTLNDLKEIILPKVNEEFVKKFGVDKLSLLKTNIKKSLEQEKKERETRIQIAAISDQIIKMTKVDIPKSLIENEKERMKAVLRENLQKQGTTLERYIENLKLTPEKIDQDLEEQAKRNIILGVGLGEIGREEKIEVGTPDGSRRVFERIVELCAK
jgi:trigger factor